MSTYPPIADLIPHTDSMIFLERVISFDEGHLRAECNPKPHHSASKAHDKVEIWSGVEYFSQAAAAYSVLSDVTRRRPRPGYLVSVRNAKFNVDHFKVGESLIVEITIEDRAGDFATFWGSIRNSSGSDLLTGRFGVYSPQ